nr:MULTISPECIES: hypothetical protein [unclassified Actinoplanes]
MAMLIGRNIATPTRTSNAVAMLCCHRRSGAGIDCPVTRLRHGCARDGVQPAQQGGELLPLPIAEHVMMCREHLLTSSPPGIQQGAPGRCDSHQDPPAIIDSTPALDPATLGELLGDRGNRRRAQRRPLHHIDQRQPVRGRRQRAEHPPAALAETQLLQSGKGLRRHPAPHITDQQLDREGPDLDCVHTEPIGSTRQGHESSGAETSGTGRVRGME